ncbi:MAG: CHASE2 domain-containing protein [Thermomonas sp.]
MGAPAFSWWKALVAALATTACVCLLLLSGITWRADAWLYDALIARGGGVADDRIVVVAVDDKSLSAFGRWPWQRGVHADLLARLQDARPSGIGFDVMFSEPFASDAQGDRALAEAVARNGRVVLPVMAERMEPNGMPIEVLPMPALVNGAAGLGHAAVDLDADGVTRSAYLRAGLGEAHWPALALALLESNGGRPDTTPPGERPAAMQATASPYLWQQDHRVLVPYVRSASFQQVSYVDVIRGQVPTALLRDRWLLIGVTAHGMGDSILTPLPGGEERMPGVLYQANLLNMLLQGTAIVPMPMLWQLPFAILLVLLPVLLLLRHPLRPARLLAIASAIFIFASSALFLLLARLWMPPMPSLLTLLLALLLLAAFRFRRSHQLAHSDALTRLANRRLFDLILHRESLAARRSGKPLSLLLIDVDHFKRDNDSCGHQAGDELLRAVAGAVARHVGRPRDLSARYGGDELAAILPETDARTASSIADAIVREVAALAIPHPDNGDNATATVSIGVAACDPQRETEASLLERTDIALYQAKKHGRNRSYTAPDWAT